MGVRAHLKHSLDDMVLSLDRFIGFDPSAYRAQISSLGPLELQTLHKQTQRKLVSITAQSGLGLAACVPTGGVSLILCPLWGRRLHVNSKRRLVIKALMRERGWKGHHFGAKDIVLGAGPVLATAALAVAVDPLVHHVADHAAQHVHHLAEIAQRGTGEVAASGRVGVEAIPVEWVEGAAHKVADLATHQAMNKGTLWVLTQDEGAEE